MDFKFIQLAALLAGYFGEYLIFELVDSRFQSYALETKGFYFALIKRAIDASTLVYQKNE